MGLFVTFEGIEGSGKTTQISRVAEGYLKKKKIPFVVTQEPGGTELGSALRNFLLENTQLDIDSRAELLLFAADRAQHIGELIAPALKQGKVVLCDRFSDATVAYQGYGRGLDRFFIKSLNDFSSCCIKPNLTLLFDIPVSVGLERISKRALRAGDLPLNDRFEGECVKFHEIVREAYIALAEAEPERFRIIDGLEDEDKVYGEVCRHMAELINR
jgi:dTMP kinase